jgi:hypothetical protein
MNIPAETIKGKKGKKDEKGDRQIMHLACKPRSCKVKSSGSIISLKRFRMSFVEKPFSESALVMVHFQIIPDRKSY